MNMLDYILRLDEKGDSLRREGEALRLCPKAEFDWGAYHIGELLSALPQGGADGTVLREGNLLPPAGQNLLRGIELRLDPGVEQYSTDVRRPYYRLRGRPVTPDRARELIRRTDDFLEALLLSASMDGTRKNPLLPDFVGTHHFNQWWFARNHSPTHYGWSHPDGTIGINAITQKYPDFHEFLQELLRWKLAFPWLELCIAVSRWDEQPDAWWRAMEKDEETQGRDWDAMRKKQEELDREKVPDEDFVRDLEIGLCIHDNVIEVLEPKNAAVRYLDYARRFAPADPEIFLSEYYERNKKLICDEAYLLRCLLESGLGEEEARELLEGGGIYLWRDRDFP